jgi:hypothetical protein
VIEARHPGSFGIPASFGGPLEGRSLAGRRLLLGATATAIALLPFIKPGGPANIAPVDPFILLAIALALYTAGFFGERINVPYALAFGLFILAGAIGAMAGPAPLTSGLAIVQDLFLLAWAAAIVQAGRSAEGLGVLLKAWVWSSVVWAWVLLAAVATGNGAVAGYTERLGNRAALTTGDPNLAAHYFFISLMLVAATRVPQGRFWRLVAYGSLLGAFVLTESNGGVVELGIGVAVTVLIHLVRRLGLVSVIAVVCLAGVALFSVSTRVSLGDVQDWAMSTRQPILMNTLGRGTLSVDERKLLVRESLALFERGHLVGIGPVGTKTALYAEQAAYVNEAHDDYIAALVERGLLGAIALLLLIGSVGVRTWTVLTKPLKPEFAAVVPRPGALVGAVVGCAVAGAFYETLHFRHLWALLGIIAALYLWGRE